MLKLAKSSVTSDILCMVVASALLPTRLWLGSTVLFLYVISRRLLRMTGSRAERFVWSYLLAFVGTIVLYCVAWLIQVNVSPGLLPVLLGAVAWLSLFVKASPSKADRNTGPYGWLSLVCAVLIMVFASLPLLQHPDSAQILRYAAKTGDDINHIGMIETDRQLQGFFYGPKSASKNLIESGSINGYPQGWHMNGALFEAGFVRLTGKDSAAGRLASYLTYKTLWLGIAVFMVSELMLTFVRKLTTSKNRYEPLVLALAVLAIGGYLLIAVFGYGFQTFIAAGALLAAGLLAGMDYFAADTGFRYSLVLVAALGMASASVWLLTAPMLLIPAVIGMGREVANRRKASALTSVGTLVFVLAFGVLSLLFLYVQIRYGKGTAGLDIGGATPPVWWLAVLAIWLACWLLLWRQGRAVLKPATAVFAVVFLEFAVVAIHQQLTLGTQRYYSIKLTFLAAMIGLAVLVPLLFRVLARVRARSRLALGSLVLAVLLLPFWAGLDIRKSLYPLKDSATISRPTAAAVLANTSPNKRFLFLSSDPGESFLATKVSAALWVYGGPQERATIAQLSGAVGALDWSSLRSQLANGQSRDVIVFQR